MKNLRLFELDFVCPDAKTQQDKMAIEQVLESQPGIEDVEVDLGTHHIKVVCADSEADMDVRRHLSQAGYPPQD